MLDSLGEMKGVTPFSVGALTRDFYREGNYARLKPSNVQRMPNSVYASLTTNEVLNSESLHIPELVMQEKGPLDGYIIGVGSGAVWAMMEFFNIPTNTKGRDMKGIISFDRDPAALMTGMVIADYAKKGADIKNVLEGFFHRKHKNAPIADDPIISRATAIVEAQRSVNPGFAEILDSFLPDLKSDLDRFTRKIVNLDSMIDSYTNRSRLLKGSYTVDLAEILFRNWEKIKDLAKQEKIAFIHADIKNAEAMDYVSRQIPDIQSSSNLIYVSNVLDHLRRAGIPQKNRHFNEMAKAFDSQHRSYYVYSRNYYLDLKADPPSLEDV